MATSKPWLRKQSMNMIIDSLSGRSLLTMGIATSDVLISEFEIGTSQKECLPECFPLGRVTVIGGMPIAFTSMGRLRPCGG
jgi:hypothetical protein